MQRASLQQEIEKLRLEVEMKQTQIRKVDQEIAHAKEEKNRLEAESRQLDEAYAADAEPNPSAAVVRPVRAPEVYEPGPMQR